MTTGFDILGSALTATGRVLQALDSDDSQSGKVSQVRLGFTVEDRELQETRDILANTVHKAFGATNQFGQFVSISKSREPGELQNIFSTLTKDLNLTQNPFQEDIGEGTPSELLEKFSSIVVDNLRKTDEFKAAFGRKGRHAILAERLLQGFKSNVGGLVKLTKTSEPSFSTGGGVQRNLKLEEELASIVPSNEAKGSAGQLSNRGRTSIEGVVITVGTPEGPKKMIAGSISESDRQLLRINFSSRFKAAILGQQGSEDSLTDAYPTLVKLNRIDQTEEIRTLVAQTAEEAKGNTREKIGAFSNALSEADKKVSDNSMVAMIKQMGNDILNNRTDGQDVIDESQRTTVRGYTEQIKIKNELIDEVRQDFINLLDYWDKNQDGSGSVRLPKFTPELERFLGQLPEGIFKDGRLSRGELEGFIETMSSDVRNSSNEENLTYSSMFQFVYGKEALEDNAFKRFLDYNTNVNKSFVDFASAALTELREGKKDGDPKLSALQRQRDREVLRLEINRAEVENDVLEKDPVGARTAKQGEFDLKTSKAIFWRQMWNTLHRSEARRSGGDPIKEGLRAQKFNELLPEAMNAIREGGDIDFINAGNELIEDMMQRYAKQIEILSNSNIPNAPKLLKAMKRQVGLELLESYGFNKNSYLVNRKALNTVLVSLNKRAEQLQKEGKKLPSRDESTRKMIKRLDTLFGEKDRFGSILKQLGFSGKQLLDSIDISNRANKAAKR